MFVAIGRLSEAGRTRRLALGHCEWNAPLEVEGICVDPVCYFVCLFALSQGENVPCLILTHPDHPVPQRRALYE